VGVGVEAVDPWVSAAGVGVVASVDASDALALLLLLFFLGFFVLPDASSTSKLRERYHNEINFQVI
jgi:hypothetical protein